MPGRPLPAIVFAEFEDYQNNLSSVSSLLSVLNKKWNVLIAAGGRQHMRN
jgi:hypothetical protein